MESDFGESDDDALIQAVTQVESSQNDFPSSPRPSKRRRTDKVERSRFFSVQSSGIVPDSSSLASDVRESQYGLGSSQIAESPLAEEAEEHEGLDVETEKASRYKIYRPEVQREFPDEFRTQVPQEATQPHMIRGAIWQKPPPEPPPPLPSARSAKKLPASRLQPWGSSSAEKENRFPNLLTADHGHVHLDHDQAFDVQKELEGLPSDAFDSSSPVQMRSRPVAPLNNLRQTTIFGRDADHAPVSQLGMRYNFQREVKPEPPTHHKLDEEATKKWIYPINLGTIREYQYNIVQRSLFHNTLVALPTGLGKTFIAATVMLNWFRWTKDAQIVFAAPTKPLVAQQVEACFNITGIPRSQTTMLTGGISPALRAEEWQSKRIFFMTPQTLINDLKSGYCDPKRIVLLVIDEAHRATGSYAYVEVVKFLDRFNQSVRVLALTATPGSNIAAVQEVIDGCNISKVEIRTEQSLDIRKYVHHRTVEREVFGNTEEMEMFMGLYSNMIMPVLTILNSQNAFWSKDPLALSAWGLQQAKRQWYAGSTGRHAEAAVKAMVSSIFAILGSLAHAMELLKFHGTIPFFHSMQAFQSELLEGRSKSKYRRQIGDHKDFQTLMMRLKRCHADPDFVGHPKLERLQEIVLNHFMDNSNETRIMVFAHYRDSAEDIVRILNRHMPIIKASVFVGQAASKNSEGMNQKKQQEIIEKFKLGTFNTLIATSIGEEGLDIGEVDLIICYDSKASPIRMLQRMGRTGRKREGKIILFQMKGKEENDAAKAKDSYEKMQELIADGGQFTFHDDKSRRILPKEVVPEVEKKIIDIPLENTQSTQMPIPSRRNKPPKRPAKKFHMPDGVITGFTTAAGGNIHAKRGPGKISAAREEMPITVEEEAYLMPTLDAVVLDESQEADWEKRYLNIVDDDDVLVSAPRLDAFPSIQREPRKTKLVPHTGRSLVLGRLFEPAGYERIESTPALSTYEDDPWNAVDDEGASFSTALDSGHQSPPRPPIRNSHPVPQKSQHFGPRAAPTKSRSQVHEAMEVQEHEISSPPKTSQAMALPTQGEWLGSEDTHFGGTAPEEELPDSELADFVVDDDAPLELDNDGSASDSESVGTLPDVVQIQRDERQRHALQSPDRGPRYSIDRESDNELPEVDTMVGRRARVLSSDEDDEESGVPVQKPTRKRRIILDSDSED